MTKVTCEPTMARDLTSPQPQEAEQEQAFAEQVLRVEAEAVAQIRVGPSFHQAVDLIMKATGNDGGGSIVVSGLGKSGIIGQKIASTFSSTGTHSHFLHATEAMHGDLGRVRREDVVVLLSFGGTTEEVLTLASILRQDGVPVIAISGKPNSELARLASVCLFVGDLTEACPMNLAPTASTTAMLALGDTLALCVMRRRNFSVEDFKRVHPGGALGRQLAPITTAMRYRSGHNMPLISIGITVRDARVKAEAFAVDGRRTGAVVIVDEHGKLSGIFTDADLAKLILEIGAAVLDMPIEEAMTPTPRYLPETALVRDAVQMAREFRIDEIPVVDQDDKPLGVIDVLDLIAPKVTEEG